MDSQLPYDVYSTILDHVVLLAKENQAPRQYGYNQIVAAALSNLCLSTRLLRRIATRHLYGSICIRTAETFLPLFRSLSKSNGEKVALVRTLMIMAPLKEILQTGVQAFMVEKLMEWLVKHKSCSRLGLNTDFVRVQSVAKTLAEIREFRELILLSTWDVPSSRHEPETGNYSAIWTKQPSLQRLMLGGVRIDAALLEALATLPNLQHLCLLFPQREEDTEYIYPLTMLSNRPSESRSVQALLQADKFPQLKRITFSASPATRLSFHQYGADARKGLEVIEVPSYQMVKELDGDLWELKGISLTKDSQSISLPELETRHWTIFGTPATQNIRFMDL